MVVYGTYSYESLAALYFTQMEMDNKTALIRVVNRQGYVFYLNPLLSISDYRKYFTITALAGPNTPWFEGGVT